MASRRTGTLALVVGALLIAAPLAAWALGAFDGRTEGPNATNPKGDLLEKAIAALGGRERLAAVKTMEVRAEGLEHGRSMKTRLVIRFPDAYRQDVDTGGGHLVHAIAGDEAWASLDGTPVALSSEEERRLEAQLEFTRLALLVALSDDDEFEVEESEPRDQLRWLEVTPARGGGPYSIGFDPESSLIRRASWETTIPGLRRPQKITAEYGDYREIDGVMVAFDATYRMDERVFAVNRIQEARLDPELPADVFQAPDPTAKATILRRTTEPALALMVSPLQRTAPGDAEKAIRTVAKELGLERNGPLFHDLEATGVAVAGVGLPIERPEALPALEAVPGRPGLNELPRREVLTLVLSDDDPELLTAARTRLLAEAERLGLQPGAPLRVVLWNDELRQLQLPVSPR